MRFVRKTRYDQDIDLFEHGGQRFWYGLLGAAVLILLILFFMPRGLFGGKSTDRV